jgi:hypothetical protein
MLATAHLFNEIEIPAGAMRAAAKQAAVWGLGGALAARLGQDKKMTKEEKKEARKDMLTQAFAGAAAGAAGSLV